MNKTLRTILIISIAVFSATFLLVLPTNAQADELIVKYWTGTEWEPLAGPLFEETNFLPGRAVTHLVKVTNNSGQPQRTAAEAINYPGFPEPNNVPPTDLSRALSIIIRESPGSDLYGGLTGEKTLFNFYQDGETYLSDISNGGTKIYEFEILFPLEKENEWQETNTAFDVLIGFQGTGGKVPPGGGGGGLPPGLTIKHEKDFYISTTTATITWDTNYKATSQVVYDTSPYTFDLTKPNYGYTFSKEGDNIFGSGKGKLHKVTLTGLTKNTVYYFRCVSHGSFAVGTEHNFTTLSVVREQEEEEKPVPVKNDEESASAKSSAGKKEKPGLTMGEKKEGTVIGKEIKESIGEEEEKPVPVLLGRTTTGKKEKLRMGLSGLSGAIGDLLNLKNLWWFLPLLIVLIIILFLLSRKKKRKEE